MYYAANCKSKFIFNYLNTYCFAIRIKIIIVVNHYVCAYNNIIYMVDIIITSNKISYLKAISPSNYCK